MLIYAGKVHKLDQVSFHFNPENFLEPWTISSNDGRLQLQFEPLMDRHSRLNALLLKTVQHQVFGYFSGTVVLDDGRQLQIRKLLGFAEDVFNRW